MKIFTGFAIVILSFLGIVYLVSELDLATGPARREASQPASKRALKVAESPAAKPAPEPPVKLASRPYTQPEPLSREVRGALLWSKEKLTNADIPASWLKEVQRSPDPYLLERRKRRAQQLSEELKLRYELAKLQAEEAERERQRQLEERRVAALEAKAEALESLSWGRLWWPRARYYQQCEERRDHRADHCRDKVRPYRTTSIYGSRGNYYWENRSCSSDTRVHGTGGIYLYGNVN